jgi:hypothetical protein
VRTLLRPAFFVSDAALAHVPFVVTLRTLVFGDFLAVIKGSIAFAIVELPCEIACAPSSLE